MSAQDLSVASQEIITLLYGVGIIVVFSYERFNRISYGTDQRLQRLIAFLTPDKLRARQKVTYAHFIYTLALLTLYLALCAYGQVLLPLLGGESLMPGIGATSIPETPAADQATQVQTIVQPNASELWQSKRSILESWVKDITPAETAPPPVTNKGIGIRPEVSMGLALVLVGLAPSIPALVRIDDWMRMVAHRMAGIPTWVIETSEALRANADTLDVFLSDDTRHGPARANELVWTSEYETFRHISERAMPHLSAYEDFRQNMTIILVVSAWFLHERLHVPGVNEKQAFKEIEASLRGRKATILERSQTNLTREGWEELASEADKLAGDLCVLVALYDEQGVILADSSKPVGQASQRQAQERLRDFVNVLYDNRTAPLRHRRGTNLTLFWCLGIILAWTTLWAITWPGMAEYNMSLGLDSSSVYSRLLSYWSTAVNMFGFSVIVALSLRWLRMMAEPDSGFSKWENLRYPQNWTRWLPQAGLVLLLSWSISTIIVLAVMLWFSGLLGDKGWNLDLWKSVIWRFEYNSPIVARGAVLALLVLILLDARQRLWVDAGRHDKYLKDLSQAFHWLESRVGQPVIPVDSNRLRQLVGSQTGPLVTRWLDDLLGEACPDGIDWIRPSKADCLSERDARRLKVLIRRALRPIRIARIETNTRIWNGLSVVQSFTWAAFGAAVMLIVTPITRFMSFWAASRGRRPFDDIDAGLMIWATMYTVILTALILFALSEVLSWRAFERGPARTASESPPGRPNNARPP